MIALRDYQEDAKQSAYLKWDAGADNVLIVLPTGAGKTVTLASIVDDHDGPSCVIAHRQELVSQISIALARNKIRHRIIGPQNVIRAIVALHMSELRQSYYDPNATCAVAGVDTLVRRNGTGFDGDFYYQKHADNTVTMFGPRKHGMWPVVGHVDYAPQGELSGPKPPEAADKRLLAWLTTVTQWIQDEAHHVLDGNKWGTAAKMFPNARGLGVTATPTRADGKGLGRHADGLFDAMIVGPTMRDLINRGYLTDYKVWCPPSNIDRDSIAISKATGDFNTNAATKAVENSSLVQAADGCIVGDIVEHYMRIANGRLGVTFVPSVAVGEKVAKQFNDCGIPAAVVSAKTPDAERITLLRRFKNRELLQLVNVDLFGEGFDLPAIEVVSMGRLTESYGLYVQQFGRALRLLEGKKFAIIIDHVGNVTRHGLPDAPRQWSLDARESRRGGSDGPPTTRTCHECTYNYERYLNACPECGAGLPAPAARTDPKFVDGDLFELDAATLEAMRAEVAEVDKPLQDAVTEYRAGLNPHINPVHEAKHVKNFAAKHEERQTAINGLREIMAMWAGYHRAAGRSDREIFKIFYIKFNISWLSAQALQTKESFALADRVMSDTGVL